MMKVAAGDHRQLALEHLIKKVGPAGDFPGIELAAKLLAAVPEGQSLLLEFSRRHRMRRDSHAALRADRAGQVGDFAMSGHELRDPQSYDMRRAFVGDRVARQLETGNHD